MTHPLAAEMFSANTPNTSSRLMYNNFDFLRLVAGVTVIYGNGLVLTGAPASSLWGAPLARFGLDFLFALSGYLVAGSWLHRPRPLAFLSRRALRVLPGLAGCVLFTVAVIGPITTHLTLHQYALNGMTLRYLENMVFVQQLWLPLVFQGQGWAGTVNPMLWTLLPGLLCGFALPASGLLPQHFRLWALAGVAALCAATAFCLPLAFSSGFYRVRYEEISTEVPFFLVAALLRHLQNHVPGLWRADIAMLLFAGNWIMATWLDTWNIVLEWVSLPYMVACFGNLSAPILGQLGQWGNPSYGLYLYAFPIQQLLVMCWPDCPHPIMACATLSLAAGYLSWHLVERPMLTWAKPRDRLPQLVQATIPPSIAQ